MKIAFEPPITYRSCQLMIKKAFVWCHLVAGLCIFGSLQAVELDYYLADTTQYNQNITTPQAHLGYQVGEWHLRPAQIEAYFRQLAEESDRVKIETIGYTHEKRPLILAYISSEKNILNLDKLRQQHLLEIQQTNSAKNDTPVVTWMGYSVHGNEASGSNASLLLAYHLAASDKAAVKEQLDNQIIIIDPMLNPDGLARFAHWVNMYRSKVPMANSETMEHNEEWPQGRTNHYWFDLNRDWLLLQHPESQARVKKFHQWRPNILTDFHEMGTNSTYFFQPGVESRQNPLTPESNFQMTATIAKSHAKALDNIGSLYYSRENFDDFYYGKGSTYPDVHGAVGILFEQASSRGHIQNNDYGKISFPFAIKNHLTTSLSTLEAAQKNQLQLKEMAVDFNLTTKKLAKEDKYRAVVFSSSDQYRINELKRILDGHQIKHYPLSKKLKLKNRTFEKGTTTIIPLRQPQYRLIKSLFETRKQFKDNVFYDVSAWNIAMAFDLDYAYVSRSDYATSLLDDVKASGEKLPSITISDATIGLAFDWKNLNTARLLSEIQQIGLVVQGVTKPTRVMTVDGEASLSLGSILLMLNNQELSREDIIDWLLPKLELLDLTPFELSSGLALSGVDMGSPSVPVLAPIKPLLIVGNGVSSYDAGEVWHLLDQRLSQPLTMMTQAQFKQLGKINYTHLILVSGRYPFDKSSLAKIENWIRQGGIIIAHSSGAKWLLEQDWTSSKVKQFEKSESAAGDTKIAYAEKSQEDAKHIIGGAITGAQIDITHPLGFGIENSEISIFKRGQQVFTEPDEAFVGVARFTDKPHQAGYISDENIQHIAGETSIFIQRLGRGRLIAFSDNPLFRGFWLGTSRVFINALYYSKRISAPAKSTSNNNGNQKLSTKKNSRTKTKK